MSRSRKGGQKETEKTEPTEIVAYTASGSGWSSSRTDERRCRKSANKGYQMADDYAEQGKRSEASESYHEAAVMLSALGHVLSFVDPADAGNKLHTTVAELREAVKRTRKYSERTTLIEENFMAGFNEEYYRMHPELSRQSRFADKYRIIGNPIGEGAFGQVHRCEKIGSKKKILAVKKIKSSSRNAGEQMTMNILDKRRLRTLHTEIIAMKEADHPNIIKIHEVFYEFPEVYIIMDLCEGGNVRELHTKSKNGLPENEVAPLIWDMLRSVQYLHEQCHIIHADIKLNNFMIEKNDDEPAGSAGAGAGTVKLIDFGESKNRAAKEGDQLRPSGQLFGTLGYIAPEVAERKPFDHRCDIWSLGICAKRLLTGQGSLEIIGNSDRNMNKLSLAARNLVERMLQKDPNNRISLVDALSHPFLAEHILPRQKLAQEAIDTIARFNRLEKPQQFLLLVIAECLEPKQIFQLNKAFQDLDTDNSGTMSYEEIEKHLSSFGKRIKSRKVNNYKGSVNLNNAEINRRQFVAAAICRSQSISADDRCLREAFKRLDTKGNDYLDIQTLQQFMGSDMGEQVANALMFELDEDRNRQISFEEFSTYCTKFMKAYTASDASMEDYLSGSKPSKRTSKRQRTDAQHDELLPPALKRARSDNKEKRRVVIADNNRATRSAPDELELRSSKAASRKAKDPIVLPPPPPSQSRGGPPDNISSNASFSSSRLRISKASSRAADRGPASAAGSSLLVAGGAPAATAVAVGERGKPSSKWKQQQQQPQACRDAAATTARIAETRIISAHHKQRGVGAPVGRGSITTAAAAVPATTDAPGISGERWAARSRGGSSSGQAVASVSRGTKRAIAETGGARRSTRRLPNQI